MLCFSFRFKISRRYWCLHRYITKKTSIVRFFFSPFYLAPITSFINKENRKTFENLITHSCFKTIENRLSVTQLKYANFIFIWNFLFFYFFIKRDTLGMNVCTQIYKDILRTYYVQSSYMLSCHIALQFVNICH